MNPSGGNGGVRTRVGGVGMHRTVGRLWTPVPETSVSMVWKPLRSGRKDDALSREETERSARPRRCRDSEGRSLLVLYALSSCSAEEAEAFEAHLLECDACFGDLQCLERAGILIREFLDSPAVVSERVRDALWRWRTDDDAVSMP